MQFPDFSLKLKECIKHNCWEAACQIERPAHLNSLKPGYAYKHQHSEQSPV